MATEDRSLQDLFASLRSSSSSRPQSAAQQPPAMDGRQQSSQPTSDSAADRTASLLSLLKFNQPGQPQQTNQSQQHQEPANLHGRGVSTSDLVASYMGKPAASTRDQPAESPALAGANPQDYLLQLLNRAQFGNGPGSTTSPPPQQQRKPTPDAPHSDPAIKTFGSSSGRDTTPSEPRTMATAGQHGNSPSKPVFTYVNPFEQLAASSPRNAGSRSGGGTPQRGHTPLSRLQSEGNKNEKKGNTPSYGRSPNPSHASPALGETVPESIEPLQPQDKSQSPFASANIMRAPTTDTATVAQALNQVSEQVSRQADYALAQAEKDNQMVHMRKREEEEAKAALQEAAQEVKQELGSHAHEKLEELLPEPVADEVKQIIDEAAEGNVDGHGTADDEKSSGNGDDEFVVPVYDFVMKPFVSIELIQNDPPQLAFRDKTITDIARLKKEFDQIDRTLATASAEYIIYSLPKSGGIRVIRQEDGVDRHVFKETRDHIFNVALSTAPPGSSSLDLQTSIATATSGTVYWTALHHDEDHIESKHIEDYCLTFPPVSAHDHTSGGQLKTRAKRSSRHPEFFAIGRGKTIQVVFPLHAMGSGHTSKKNVVNTEAYFKERSLKINTGKAGKDFTFSEDDTAIASLDKAGRLRFWDIRELVSLSNSNPDPITPTQVQQPMITYLTAVPNEKSWPTSVLLVDKLRAYVKGTALRYVIVGMKQNHTLQLWDLGLGKAIQEVHFPHSKESDAICSVCYHPPSGIIVVGHPTRNSIYFIHLSAPKYNLSGISQAKYMTMLADKDDSLPKPDSTAIMSGMREYSFASKGQLRSVDILPVSGDGPVSKDQPALFELYVMHSKGVTMLSISREDLGWSEDMKVVTSFSAQDAGIARITEIVQPPPVETSENSSINGDAAGHAKASAGDASRKTVSKAAGKIPEDTEDRAGSIGAPADKADRRKKKKLGAAAEDAAVQSSRSATYASAAAKPAMAPQTDAQRDPVRTSPKKQPAVSAAIPAELDSTPISDVLEKELPKMEARISAELSRVLKQQMEALYKRLNDDRRVIEAQHGANQEAVLRMVSKSLGENVESSLNRIVSESIQRDVVPAIKNNTISAVQKDVTSGIANVLTTTLQDQLKQGLAEATTKAFQDADAIQVNSTQVSSGVSHRLSKDIEALIKKYMPSKATTANADAMERLSSASNAHLNRLLTEASSQRQVDADKIDHLVRTVQNLSQAVSAMDATQRQLREEVVQLKSELPVTVEGPVVELQSPSRVKPASRRASQNLSSKTAEVKEIAAAMTAGEYEEATFKWLQSPHQADLFDNYFVNVDPEYLQQCLPLVVLSVAAAVTESLQNNLAARLTWLDTILESLDLEDSEIKDVAPKIMGVLGQRLESYMELSRHNSTDPSLQHIPRLIRRVHAIAEAFQR